MAITHAAAFTHTRAWSQSEFDSLLQSPLIHVTGDARCFALVRCIADEAELLTIATHPDHQRKGLARAVMAAWQADAVQRGVTTAFLEVAADNIPACALYQACGYKILATRTGYYLRTDGSRADANVMQRSFSAQR